MAELSTLARPYAEAAFDYAKENHCVSEWQNYLTVMTAIISNEAFENYLHNPAVSASDKVAALKDIYNDSLPEEDSSIFKELERKILAAIDSGHHTEGAKSGQLAEAFLNFLTQLAEQNRLPLLPVLAEQFSALQANDAKEIHAYVTSAYPLTKAQELLIEERLSKSLGSSVVIHVDVDSSLMAGVTIKIGDKLIDDSVRGKLKQLKTQLTA